MKKFFVLIVLTIVCIFCFVGCVNTPDSPNTSTDLGNYEVGYKLDVYPNIEFNYKINDDFIVHISNISVTFVEKNEIKANDTIENSFYPYVTRLEVSGHTNTDHSGKCINIRLISDANSYSCNATINEDGTFYGYKDLFALRKANTLYFYQITIA
ncbi:MAG: hypothetical protein K2O31_06390 [Clostridia bacterium]|nr:hypothetical protein [Clostridia bacterium]